VTAHLLESDKGWQKGDKAREKSSWSREKRGRRSYVQPNAAGRGGQQHTSLNTGRTVLTEGDSAVWTMRTRVVFNEGSLTLEGNREFEGKIPTTTGEKHK